MTVKKLLPRFKFPHVVCGRQCGPHAAWLPRWPGSAGDALANAQKVLAQLLPSVPEPITAAVLEEAIALAAKEAATAPAPTPARGGPLLQAQAVRDPLTHLGKMRPRLWTHSV